MCLRTSQNPVRQKEVAGSGKKNQPNPVTGQDNKIDAVLVLPFWDWTLLSSLELHLHFWGQNNVELIWDFCQCFKGEHNYLGKPVQRNSLRDKYVVEEGL